MTLPNRIIPTGTALVRLPERPAEGNTIVIYSRGRFRLAEVESVGRVNARVAYTTDSAHITRKAVPLDECYRVASPDAPNDGVVRDSSYGVEGGRHAARGFARRGRRGGDRLVAEPDPSEPGAPGNDDDRYNESEAA